jgi:opacity protein-like surface antigen
MKKISTTLFVTALCFSSMAHAGESFGKHSFGVNAMMSSLSYHEVATKSTFGGNPRLFAGNSDSSVGAGLAYKYIMNFDKIYVAPGLFYEKPNASSGGSGPENTNLYQMQIKDRYGVSLDLGYDVTETITPYFTGGYSSIRYLAKDWRSSSGVPYSAIKRNTIGDWYYGAGIKAKINKDFSIALEYNTQKFDAKTAVVNSGDYQGTYVTRLNLVKLGVFYNF